MSNLNTTILQGNLTADPEVFGTDKKVTKFTIAVNNGYGEYKSTTFVTCVSFGKTGELIATHFEKGKPVIVQGELRTSKWESKEGEKRSSLELHINQMNGWFFQNGSPRGGGDEAQTAATSESSEELF